MAGGKGLNVSRVASILGARVMATGFLGGGNGQFIRAQLQELGIIDAFTKIEGDTRICIAINDPILDTSTEVLEPGPEICPEEQEEFLNNFRNIVKEADIVTISGSLPRGVPIDFYGKLIEISRESGKRLLLDTSGQTLVTSLEYRPFMIKPNVTELEAVTGREKDMEAEMACWEDQVQSVIDAFKDESAVCAARDFPSEAGQPMPRAKVSLDQGVFSADIREMDDWLKEGEPSIYLATIGDAFYINPQTLMPGEMEIIIERLKEAIDKYKK
jgi:fructose-1-phosphate kinase PfkB-like protein